MGTWLSSLEVSGRVNSAGKGIQIRRLELIGEFAFVLPNVTPKLLLNFGHKVHMISRFRQKSVSQMSTSAVGYLDGTFGLQARDW